MIYKLQNRFNILLRKIWLTKLRKRLCNKSFSIISSNCFGGHIYQLLGEEYRTPTVGLFFYAPCFIKFLKNLEAYLEIDIVFIERSKYEVANSFIESNYIYPIGQIADIEIHFLHYKSEEEARLKWEKRKKRVNLKSIYITMTDRDLCTLEEIAEFEKLKYSHKVIFTSKDYRKLFPSSVWLKKYHNNTHVGVITNPKTGEKELRKRFDIIKWLVE